MSYKKTNFLAVTILGLLLSSCVSNKDLLYFGDANMSQSTPINYTSNTLQPNDILDIKIGALVPETAIPYNNQTINYSGQQIQNIDLLKLQGYLVGTDGSIVLPILGKIEVVNKSIASLEQELISILEDGQHLVSPSVSVRLLNAKVTVLGEVGRPGTYTFTEQFISLPQALGYAGDLSINGKRTDILLIREQQGERRISQIDLTTTNWMNNPEYRIMPNDVIVVNPNNAKVKSAGIIGNASTVVSIVSVLLSITILLTR
jgi:polysaccharide export outer membrane protein